MEFLVVFGYEWDQEEIQVDKSRCRCTSSLEAMIEAMWWRLAWRFIQLYGARHLVI